MAIDPVGLDKLTGLASRFGAFVADRYPFALSDAIEAFDAATGGREPKDESGIETIRATFRRELLERLSSRLIPSGLNETTPGVSAEHRLTSAHGELVEACDGFLRRQALIASLTREERREILRGMILTRATDNRLKAFFTSGEIKYGSASFQGKGFRSLGQEAIYAAAIRFRRGQSFRAPDGTWNGDVIGPVIRDLGATLAMRYADAAVVVCNPEVSSVRDSDRIIGLLDSKTVKAEKGDKIDKHLLITRYEPQRATRGEMLSIDDVLEILSIPLIGIVPESEEVLRASNLGSPVPISSADSAPARAYMDAARRLSGETIEMTIPTERRSLLNKLFGRRAA